MMKTIPAMVVLAALASACSRHDDDKTTVTSAKMQSSSGPQENDALAAAKRWDAAMSQRDLSLLANVYGKNVLFYGVPLRHDQVIQALSDMFVKDPSFTQSISDVRTPAADRVELEQTKVVTGKSRSEKAWLELAREDGALVVVEQSDADTDARLAAQTNAKEEYCEGLAQRVVMSTNKGRSLVDVPRGPGGSGYANEVRLVVTPPSWPAYVVAVIDHTTPKPVAIGWFDVVPQTGEVSDAFGGETLKPDADLVAALRKCPK
ncbi:MAG TPA: hypothetical protein VGH87_26755 [Polyangiaceae bacterium]